MLAQPHRLVAAICLLLSQSAIAPSAVAVEPPDFDQAKLKRASQALQPFIEKKAISGGVTLVATREGIAHLQAIGLADVDAKRPMQRDNVFWIASMTKPITATAVMILQDRGKLSVDDPVAKYFPSFKTMTVRGSGKGKDQTKPTPATRAITLRDLMTHTSGVNRPRRQPQANPSLLQKAQSMGEAPLNFQPGSQWKYSGGLDVCGAIVEKVSGMAFDTFLEKEIFAPLGMKDTTFYPNAEQRKRLATLYRPVVEGKGDARRYVGFEKATPGFVSYDPKQKKAPGPSGGLASTANDLAQFYRMVLRGGELDGKRILSEQAVKQMTTVHTGELTTGFTPGNGWGLGWCVVRQPQGVTKMLSPGTYGHGGAFGTQGWVDPKRGVIYVLLIQRTGYGNSDASSIRGAFQQAAVDAMK